MENKIILYTIGCPACKKLEEKLKNANLNYDTIEDRNVMLSKGIQQLPVLEVNGVLMSYLQAWKWISMR